MAMKRDMFLSKLFCEADTFDSGEMTIYFKDLTPESRSKVYELIKQYDEFADAFSDDTTKKMIDLYLFGGQRQDGEQVQPIPMAVINGSQIRDNMTL